MQASILTIIIEYKYKAEFGYVNQFQKKGLFQKNKNRSSNIELQMGIISCQFIYVFIH